MIKSYVILILLFLQPIGANAEPLTVQGNDLFRIGRFDWIAPRLVPDAPDRSLPLIAPDAVDAAAMLLRRMDSDGRAAGFNGLVYDNRDRGHSSLPPGLFPQLARLTYGEKLRKAGLDYALGGQILLPTIVFGNSSTAMTSGTAPRSLPHLAMTTSGWPERAFRTYVSNHIYVYPEHRDHDAVDLFPANWPYMIVSQGSSGSDRVFLRAIAMTLAAMAPDTRDRLQRAALIAPILQMILRRSLAKVTSRDAYLSGAAHPTVFDGDQLSLERMVSLAASLRPEDIPPLVRLSVVREDFKAQAGLGGLSERLFDTPSAIARLWRRLEGRSEMVVTAQDTRDPNGRDLIFTWVLLRGDPEKVQISPQDDHGVAARITIDWQDARPIVAEQGAEARLSSRIDIGVFARNGVHDSAPAFISVSFPTHQVRDYRTGPDGQLQLSSVDYNALARQDAYDPLLYWSAPWRDVVSYDDSGNLTGWRREQGDEIQNFDALGRRADGSVLSYEVVGQQGRWPTLRAIAHGASDGANGNR